MNVFIRAMVRIFSFGERWNVPFNSAVASLNGTFQFHRMKIFLPLHEYYKNIYSLFVYYNPSYIVNTQLYSCQTWNYFGVTVYSSLMS